MGKGLDEMTTNSGKHVITFRTSEQRYKKILRYQESHKLRSLTKALDSMLDKLETNATKDKQRTNELKEYKRSSERIENENVILKALFPECADSYPIVGNPTLRECGLKPKDRFVHLPKKTEYT